MAIVPNQNEPDTNRRSDVIDDIYYTHWIIVSAVVLVIVIVAVAFTSTEKYPDMPQTITSVIVSAPSP